MNKLTHIEIGGFRRLHELSLPMRPLMVLIGANGVGKTSLLDALSLLASSAAGRLGHELTELGGLSSLLTRGQADGISLRVDLEVPAHEPLEYQLRLAARGPGYGIAAESLSQQREGFEEPFRHIDSREGDIRYFETEQRRIVQPDWDHDPLETSLSQVPKMFRQPEELRRILGSLSRYHALDVGPRAPVKLPQQLRPAERPGADGGELVSLLYNLRESDSTRFEAIVDTLRAAFPGFEQLSFPPVAAGMLAMTWKDRSFAKPLYTNELSEGTLRFLWLVALLHAPGLSTLTLVDEPEVSLHPELLGLLADLLREASQHSQLIVATHSDRLIRFLEPEEVVVMDIDDEGHATATWADTLDLDAWLEEYTLDGHQLARRATSAGGR